MKLIFCRNVNISVVTACSMPQSFDNRLFLYVLHLTLQLLYSNTVCPVTSADIVAPIKRLLLLRFHCDVVIKITIRLRFGFDSTTTENEHVHFFVASRGVVANKKAVGWTYNDAIVYVTVIRMAFTLTDEHRVASFDWRRWYSPFTHFRSKMSSGLNSCLH